MDEQLHSDFNGNCCGPTVAHVVARNREGSVRNIGCGSYETQLQKTLFQKSPSFRIGSRFSGTVRNAYAYTVTVLYSSSEHLRSPAFPHTSEILYNEVPKESQTQTIFRPQ